MLLKTPIAAATVATIALDGSSDTTQSVTEVKELITVKNGAWALLR